MDRDTAAKLEGMMLASRAQLEHVAEFVRTQVPDPQQRPIMLKVAAALTELVHISRVIHDEHAPLNPYKEEQALAAEMRKARESGRG
ncbi:MAG: hypothetical protein JSS04_11865 [Proteobacteria bacterium]|nr:hypothetical protein [Pseudomonadota bacterium]